MQELRWQFVLSCTILPSLVATMLRYKRAVGVPHFARGVYACAAFPRNS